MTINKLGTSAEIQNVKEELGSFPEMGQTDTASVIDNLKIT